VEQGCDWLLPCTGANLTDSPLTESLAALSRFFVGDGTVHETLQRVSELATVAVEGADLVGLTMIVEGRQRTAVFTDELAPELDRTQYETDDGPCVEAFRSGEIREIESTLQEGPWPEFRRAAAEHGVRSTLSFPMLVNKQPLGAMNLYSRHERAFSEQDREMGTLFASQAAIVLANAQAYWDARQLSARLGEAMEARSVIEQAKGILMSSEGCDDEDAFNVLVKASQRENVKLRDVARRIVDDTITRGRRT
jgi:GAF domain-containing protein